MRSRHDERTIVARSPLAGEQRNRKLDTMVPPIARKAQPRTGATLSSRDWALGDSRLRLSFDGLALACDWLPPGTQPGAGRRKLPPIARVGAVRRPVRWQVARWCESESWERGLELQSLETGLEADIRFAFDRESGLVAQSILLRNRGTDAEIEIRRTNALCLAIHEPIARISTLAGGWSEEMQLKHATPADCPLILGSRVGRTGFDFQPYAALQSTDATYLTQLLWSGNWRLVIEQEHGTTALSGGFHDWRFRHCLAPGEELALPPVLFGRLEGGLEAATRRLHDWRRARRPDRHRPIPVQFNSWYPHPGEPSAASLQPLLPVAKRLGCEVFVVDAGWYCNEDGDSTASWEERGGDWRVSRSRFPEGMRALGRRCHAVGLGFGLWFEPEVIGPASPIRRLHPEWLHHVAGRPPEEAARAILHLGVPEAWQHVHDRLFRVLSHGAVDWMKWDFNCEIGDGGWAPCLPRALTRQAPLVAHYQGLYRLLDALRAAFPGLVLEMCASGGGRLDAGLLSHAHVNWISDQIGPLKQLAIHMGAHYAHPPVACNGWLIDWPPASVFDDRQCTAPDLRGDLALRLRVAMLGSFGLSAPIGLWSEAEHALAAAHIALYRERLRPLIHHGDLHKLTAPPPADGTGDWAACCHVAKDGLTAALFAFRLAGTAPTASFGIPGLRADRRYRIVPFEGAAEERSGADLASGLRVVLEERFRSALYRSDAGALPASAGGDTRR